MGKAKRLCAERKAFAIEQAKTAEQTIEHGISTRQYYIIKYIAVISMLIDHLGRVLYEQSLISDTDFMAMFLMGRLAFPLFAFELVECFYFTKSRKKHLLELGVLALLSEAPFDFALTVDRSHLFRYGDIIDYSCLNVQNTCYTLFLSFLMLIIVNKLEETNFKKWYKGNKIRRFVSRLSRLIVCVLFMLICQSINADYRAMGVLLVGFLYFARRRKYYKFWQVVGIIIFLYSISNSKLLIIPTIAVSVLIIISQRKKNQENQQYKVKRIDKALRYFYPIHLLVLALFRFVHFVI